MFIEVGATVLGLIQGVLVMLNKRSNWIFYILQMILLLIFSLMNHLYGDVFNNIIYIVMGIIGLILWNRDQDTNKISRTNTLEKIIYILVICIGAIFVSIILRNTSDPLPTLDAFTTVSSFVATYYMMKRKIDTWVIWFINDIFYAVEYFILPNQAIYLFVLNIIWAFMAIGSYINWYRIMKGDKDD